MRLEGWHLILIIALALLLFAGPKLPNIAKNLGQSMRVFRKEMKTMGEERAADKAVGKPSSPSEDASASTQADSSANPAEAESKGEKNL